jgi:transposase InsO family protein
MFFLSQFESELFTEMCQLLQINKTMTTPYHPKSDGIVERFNKTLATMVSSYVNEHHTNWDILLPYVMMAYRPAEHETTGCTPNRLMLDISFVEVFPLRHALERCGVLPLFYPAVPKPMNAVVPISLLLAVRISDQEVS